MGMFNVKSTLGNLISEEADILTSTNRNTDLLMCNSVCQSCLLFKAKQYLLFASIKGHIH